jgi:L-methionine (R)-S-oxide reductase
MQALDSVIFEGDLAMSTFENPTIPTSGIEFYSELCLSLQGLLSHEPDPIAQLANASALINHHLIDVNWVGFYMLRGDTLVVGPFQGKPACTRIAIGRGVCGKVAQTLQTAVVDDVHAFPGHIACDASSRSEIVLPLISKNGKIWGVLDLDSPKVARFSDEDRIGLEMVRSVIEKTVLWSV